MVRKAAGVLASLGLIGGAGSVAYNQHGDATVKITDQNGQVHSVQISSANGTSFSCPSGTDAKLEPIDIRAGRIKLTLQALRRSERQVMTKYPTHTAPHAVVVRYAALIRRDDRLVDAFNAEIDAHNAILHRDCTAD